MESKECTYNNFVFYGSMRQTVDALPKEMGDRLLRAIMNYGTTGEIDDSDSVIYAIMLSIIPNINAAQKRHQASIEKGNKGGRRKEIDDDKILELHSMGFKQRQISEQLNISIKSVQRALGQKTKLGHNQEIDIDIDSDDYMYTDKDKDKQRDTYNESDIAKDSDSYIETDKDKDVDTLPF